MQMPAVASSLQDHDTTSLRHRKRRGVAVLIFCTFSNHAESILASGWSLKGCF